LIEKETGLSNERSLISAVFHNRLRKNLRLECDATVIYAVKLVKAYDGVINQSDLKLDSPYNTYLYPGLPAGPIANPGLEAIDAALYPAEVDYLFFVLANEGRHIFSSNYRDHNQAVAQYQR
ncbi:MAG: endolytic transglycosylase MltG, partial [Acidobacteria bacterium]|nr:endolytic transglycosylase MltG [Acidobacteriota bacterium]